VIVFHERQLKQILESYLGILLNSYRTAHAPTTAFLPATDFLPPTRVVPTENVRAALAAVEAGNVDAGVVYKTDARG